MSNILKSDHTFKFYWTIYVVVHKDKDDMDYTCIGGYFCRTKTVYVNDSGRCHGIWYGYLQDGG